MPFTVPVTALYAVDILALKLCSRVHWFVFRREIEDVIIGISWEGAHRLRCLVIFFYCLIYSRGTHFILAVAKNVFICPQGIQAFVFLTSPSPLSQRVLDDLEGTRNLDNRADHALNSF
jgi:hypothetical protein